MKAPTLHDVPVCRRLHTRRKRAERDALNKAPPQYCTASKSDHCHAMEYVLRAYGINARTLHKNN